MDRNTEGTGGILIRVLGTRHQSAVKYFCKDHHPDEGLERDKVKAAWAPPESSSLHGGKGMSRKVHLHE